MKKLLIVFTVVTIIIAFGISCNLDNDGIFYRASLSEPIVDVGAVTVIDFDDAGNIIALTKSSGLRVYNPTADSWSYPTETVSNTSPILSSLLATDADGDIYAGEQAGEGENNTIYSITKDTDTFDSYSTLYDVESMGLHGDIMVVDTGTNFEVQVVSSPGTAVTDGTFSKDDYTDARILAQDDTTYLLSLYNASTDLYTSYLFEGVTRHEVISGSETAVRAFFVDSTDQGIFILSDGTIYHSDDVTSTTVAPADSGYSVSLTDTDEIIEFLPIITNGDAVYMQILENAIYSIDMDTGEAVEAAADIATTLTTVDIISYITDGAGNNFAGTIEHGIIEITFN